MFKSCFPNSALTGSMSDPVPPISENPFDLSLPSAKGVYIDILNYFATKPDTLFIVVTAPPLVAAETTPASAANARAFNRWLVNDWLKDYPYNNVYVFDFYNVLTSNGGNSDTSDLGSVTGNHHRWRNGAVEYITDQGINTAAYPTGDSHPSQAGNLKATGEYLPLLNYAYNRWIASQSTGKIGIFRPSAHQFILDNGSETTTITWGTATDTPVAGDWNGDGMGDVGVFRGITHTFTLKNGTEKTKIVWGGGTDIPVSGDWNGDGMGDVGVFRNSTHTFILKNGTAKTKVSWGVDGDLPVAGDWNSDGMGDVGVFRPSTHKFILKNGTARTLVTWGQGTDLPVSGDWNADGLADVGVFRPSTHTFILKNGTERTTVNWGESTDVPVAGRWS